MKVKFKCWSYDLNQWLLVTAMSFEKQLVSAIDGSGDEHVFDFDDPRVRICQFTGCVDAAEQWIFEGDILRDVSTGDYAMVSFDAGGFNICWQQYFWKEPLYPRNFDEHLLVVGNIFENIDLLGGDRHESYVV